MEDLTLDDLNYATKKIAEELQSLVQLFSSKADFMRQWRETQTKDRDTKGTAALLFHLIYSGQ